MTRTFDEIMPQLAQALKQAKLQQTRQDYLNSFAERERSYCLHSPPKMQVGYDPARVRGNPKAPVMIVEFSEFQCPYTRLNRS